MLNDLSDANLGWLAAMIDGDGCISLGRSRQRYGDTYAYSTVVSVGNTSMLILDHLLATTRMGKIHPTRVKGNRKPASIWRIVSGEQKVFLPIIMPHLVIKRSQAELMLDFFGTVEPHRGSGYVLPPDIHEKRATIYSKMAELNRRGVAA